MTFRRSLPAMALSASIAPAILSGCVSDDAVRAVPLSATLAAGSEVPPVMTAAAGTLDGSYDRTTHVLRWTLRYEGLSGAATAAHFHGPALPGQNAGVVVPFAGPLASPIQGQATLTPEQASDLLEGKWYVNVHTQANPGGETRGQVSAGGR